MLARKLKWMLLARLLGSAAVAALLADFGGPGWAALSILIFVLADAPFLALAYALARKNGWPPPGGHRPDAAQALAAGLREWANFFVLFTILQPFESFFMGQDFMGEDTSFDSCVRVEAGATPVLLAHGYCCNRAIWWWMGRRLRAKGLVVATVNFEPTFGDIDAFADQLRARIDSVLAETGASRLTLATHSMGGLVARAYLRRYGDAKVAALVTLAAPHHGSLLARLALGLDARQMEPDSAWLRELGATKIAIPVVAVWSVSDEFVAPQDSARWPGARELALAGHDHMSMVFSDRAASIIGDAAVEAPGAARVNAKNAALSTVG
jgi:pimeloyl-ACP methyl ester carboxylesterase